MISRARSDDLDAIMVLEESGFDHATWSRDSWVAELDGDDRQVLVYRGADGSLLAVATVQLVDDYGDLLRVVVEPAHRRRGIARQLLLAAILMAQAQGAVRVLLEVENGNTAALAVYRRLGFAPIDRRRDYYGPGLDALVMELRVDELPDGLEAAS